MSLVFSGFNSGFGIGLAVAAPIGPMGLLCIQRTLSTGLRAGFVTGLGAATVHGLYGAAAAIGVVASLKSLVQSEAWTLQILSAALLVFFATRLLVKGAASAPASDEAGKDLSRHYQSALALGATNPLTFLLLLAAFTAQDGQVGGAEMVLGLVCGSAAWWLALSVGVSLVRTKLNLRAMRLVNVACALCLLGLAGTTVRAALAPPSGAVAESTGAQSATAFATPAH